ncbi:MAG: superoxide dismutase [Alphaproteobacteria bacterium]|nr:superoxide dismutase [Alphaproteobacteria bacterium]
MAFALPALPYSNDALAPHISAETLSFHHGKHHAGYVTKLNAAVDADASLKGKSLEDLIKTTSGGVFNNAAQVFNHTFYWNSLSPNGGGEPKGAIKAAIDRDFGSFAAFKDAFTAAAGGHFGSGWAWLVKNASGKLEIVQTHDAGCPLTSGQTPILTCDVWEHAYYIDYRNARPDYINGWWALVNWDFANANL